MLKKLLFIFTFVFIQNCLGTEVAQHKKTKSEAIISEIISYAVSLHTVSLHKELDADSAIKMLYTTIETAINEERKTGKNDLKIIKDSFATLMASYLLISIYFEKAETTKHIALEFSNKLIDMIQNYLKINCKINNTKEKIALELHLGVEELRKLMPKLF